MPALRDRGRMRSHLDCVMLMRPEISSLEERDKLRTIGPSCSLGELSNKPSQHSFDGKSPICSTVPQSQGSASLITNELLASFGKMTLLPQCFLMIYYYIHDFSLSYHIKTDSLRRSALPRNKGC